VNAAISSTPEVEVELVDLVDITYQSLRRIKQVRGRRDFIIVAVAAVCAGVSTLAVNIYFLYRFEPTMTR